MLLSWIPGLGGGDVDARRDVLSSTAEYLVHTLHSTKYMVDHRPCSEHTMYV